MKELQDLYICWKGEAPASTEQLPGAGSNRIYYRMADAAGNSVVGCVGTSREENHAFIVLARHFSERHLPVPQVLAVSDDEMRYLQTDLGSTSLFDVLVQGRQSGGNYSDEEISLLEQTIRLLPRLQFEGASGLDFSVCYPQPAFDETGVMFDLNYFKYCYLKATGLDFHELRLEEDFRRMAHDLTTLPSDTFLYRDFQARNVMVATTPASAPDGNSAGYFPALNRLYFIDFQGGRRGPVYYDLASFLWQASARYTPSLRQHLVDVYYAEACRYTDLPSRAGFDSRMRLFVLFRLLQVLGAYGFRGYFERKQHFIDSIPPALDNVRQLLADGDFPYPCLMDVLHRLTRSSLVVTVWSFSYKRGIPVDDSGHGGGYVFDCRAPHNPGRYEQYKQLTGLDKPVIDFLEADGEIVSFLDAVYRLADAHVQRYVERGFTNLMFCFGCTGGQHRSVYSAQHLADHLRRRFPMVEIRLRHRELGIGAGVKNN